MFLTDLLAFIHWNKKMVIISNDCSDHLDILLDLISKELKDIQHIDVTKKNL